VSTTEQKDSDSQNIQFNVAEASERSITSFRELPAEGVYEGAAAVFYWSLDGGRGFVRIGYWQDPPFPHFLDMETDFPGAKEHFEKGVTQVLKKKWSVKKAMHKNGAVGFIAFGEGVDFERCGVGSAVLKLGNQPTISTYDTLVDAAICSESILTPNTMDNLIWYLKKVP
tara:strand:- start:12 stop:521 length:510 start_codon:yes stop_codon:yes gene_type:complete